MRYLCRINILFLTFLLVGISQVFAQEVKTTSSSNQESTIYDHMQVQSDSLFETPTQLGDIPLEELEAFDPSTVPESVPIPEADWIFEVPISVKNIPDNIKKIGIQAIVFKFMKDGKRVDFGKGKRRIELTEGSFDGKVTIGVSYSEDMIRNARDKYYGDFLPSDAKEYEVWMYLIGPDNSWYAPSLKQVSPGWRMADNNHAFNWKTGRHNLPTSYGSGENIFDPEATGTVGDSENTETSTPLGFPDLPISPGGTPSDNKDTINPGSVGDANTNIQ